MRAMGRRVLAILSETLWLAILMVVVMFAFFLALGAVSPGQAVGATIVVAVLAALWVLHAVWEAHRRAGRDPAAIRARERRGF